MTKKKTTKKVVVKDSSGNDVVKDVEVVSQTLTLNAPKDVSAFTHSDGTQYTVEDGKVDIDPDHVSEATRHGFTI